MPTGPSATLDAGFPAFLAANQSEPCTNVSFVGLATTRLHLGTAAGNFKIKPSAYPDGARSLVTDGFAVE